MNTLNTLMKNFTGTVMLLTSLLFGQFTIAQTYIKDAISILESETKQPVLEKPGSFNVAVTTDVNTEKFLLLIDNPSLQKLKIIVRGAAEDVFSDKTSEKRYLKRFDLANAEDGEYIIKITSGNQKFTKRIVINTATLISRKIDIQ